MKTLTCLFLAFFMHATAGCKKDSDPANDLASRVVGTYGGAVPPGILGGRLLVSRRANTLVHLERTTSSGFYKYYGIATVVDGGEGKYTISLTTDEDTISGTVHDSIFICYFNSWCFYGVKQ